MDGWVSELMHACLHLRREMKRCAPSTLLDYRVDIIIVVKACLWCSSRPMSTWTVIRRSWSICNRALQLVERRFDASQSMVALTGRARRWTGLGPDA